MVSCDGVVLAGGQSRRMGSSKGDLELSPGITLLDHAVTTLEAICQGLIWVSRPYAHAVSDARELPDSAPNRGPLQGILEAFRHSSKDVLAVLAVDLPLVTCDLYHLLYAAWRQSSLKADVVYGYVLGGDEQPLAGWWHRRSMEALERAASQSTVPRVQSVLENLTVLRIALADPRWITNVNTPVQWLSFRGESSR